LTGNRPLDVSSGSRQRQLNRIYKRDRGICQLCGEPCSREDASRDHRIELRSVTIKLTPEQRAYLQSDRNVQLAHIDCNNQRSNRSGSELEVPEAFPDFPYIKPKPGERLTYNIGEIFQGLASGSD